MSLDYADSSAGSLNASFQNPTFLDFFSRLYAPPPPPFDPTTYDWSQGSKTVSDLKGLNKIKATDTWTVDPQYDEENSALNALKVYTTGKTSPTDLYRLLNPTTGEITDTKYFPKPPPPPEPWNEWFKTDNTNWSGFVSDPYQWAQNLEKLGFKGNVGRYPSRGEREAGKTEFQFTPEAKKAIEDLKKQGYDFLYRPNTHNNYNVTVTPQGTYQLNTRGTSFLQGIAPVLGILAAPLTGGLSSALAPALGAAAPIASQALISGGLGALSGGDFLTSAIKGGVTGGIGALATPIASSIGADVLSSTGSQALADIASGAIKGGAGALPGALISGDLGNVLSGALTGGVTSGVTSGLSDITGLAPKDISNAIKAVQNLDNPLAIAGIASSYLPGPTMPGAGTTEDIQEGFFEPGGPGFMPTEYLDDAEVDRELRSLLGRAPAPQAPSDWFLGENIMSGVPEWDISGVNAGLPIGNLEQDFSVAQTKEGPRIVDSAGNVGTFVNGEFVVDTGVTPDLSYANAPASAPASAPIPSAKPTPAPAPAATVAKKQDDLGLLMALAGMMTPQQQAKDDYQLAQIGVASPYGIYGA